jgi:hypothetical protein
VNTITKAWGAFLKSIEEAQELHEHGGDLFAMAELVQHARELLDIIDEELVAQSIALPNTARDALMQMRERVQRLERDVAPTRQ